MFTTVACPHCRGHIEFETADSGRTVNCPHCGESVILSSGEANPPPLPKRPAKKSKISSAVIGCTGGLVAFFGLFFFLAWIGGGTKPTPGNDGGDVLEIFDVGGDASGSIVKISGKARNLTGTELRRVRVLYNIYDSSNNKIGEADDYLGSLAPYETWKFEASSFAKDVSHYRFDYASCSYGQVKVRFIK